VAAVFEHLDVESGASFSHDGDPRLFCFRGEDLVIALDLLGGEALCSSGPGLHDNFQLTQASADWFFHWLDERGVSGPYVLGTAAERRIRQLNTARWAQDALLPAGLKWSEYHTLGRRAFGERLTAAFPDPIERGVFCLRVVGCDESRWVPHFDTPIHVVLDDLLPAISRDALSAALPRAIASTEGRTGAVQWLLRRERTDSITRDAFDAALPVIGDHALTSPSPELRESATDALAALAAKGNSTAQDVLRGCVWGHLVARTIDQRESYVNKRRDADTSRRPSGFASDAARSAWYLAQMSDRLIRPSVEELLERARGEDRVVLEQALALLREE
jgi:hypothetical protein